MTLVNPIIMLMTIRGASVYTAKQLVFICIQEQTGWIDTGKIWAPTAEQLNSSSNKYNYQVHVVLTSAD